MAILPGLVGAIGAFKLPGGISIERTTADVDAKGYPIASAPTVIPIPTAVVWQLKGRDLLNLPEGDRTSESIGVIVPLRIRTAREGSDEMADVVLYTPAGEAEERRYVVRTAEDWIAQSGHYRCFCVREESD